MYADYYDEIIEGVSPRWLRMFDKTAEKLGKSLKDILSTIPLENTTPPPKLMLEMCRYCDPIEIKFIIIGQDPYPIHGDAEGLCFSGGNGSIPRSLQKIYSCLVANKLIAYNPANDSKRYAHLHHWAVQGGLLINKTLTVTVGQPNSHLIPWEGFVPTLITTIIESFITNKIKRNMFVLMWGKDAQSCRPRSAILNNADDIDANPFSLKCLEWCHPVARLAAPVSFNECPHFADVTKAHRVAWGRGYPVDIFTDGACSGNGKAHANARFGLMINCNHYSASISGVVKGFQYCLTDTDKTQNLLPFLMQIAAMPSTGNIVAPSNNRGELLAICYALLCVYKLKLYGSTVTIISDSKYCIDAITKWHPNWVQKGPEALAGKENLDMLGIAAKLMAFLQNQRINVVFRHIRSHEKMPAAEDFEDPKIHAKEVYYWKGNDVVDKLAQNAKAFSVESTIGYLIRVIKECEI